MTREEAENKLRMISGGAWQDNLLNALEQLGLLKFDEVTPTDIIEFNFKASGIDNPKLRAKEVISHLSRCNYQIVDKNDDNVSRLVAACRRFVKSRNTMDEASAIKCIETYTKELD